MENQRVILITGASSGFGKVTGSLLAQRGYRVFGTSRRPQGDRAENIEMLRLDVDSDASVRGCVEQLIEKAGRLDVLVNNAGFVLTGAIEETTTEEAKSQFETNFFGAVRMVNAVLPIMRQQHGGQIINIGSLSALLPIPFESSYVATKAALKAYTETLRYEVKNFGIRVSLVMPGFFRTNLGESRRDSAAKVDAYDEIRRRSVPVLLKHIREGGEPELVAGTILHIIQSRSPRLNYLVGREKWYARVRNLLPESAFEGIVRRHWKLDR